MYLKDYGFKPYQDLKEMVSFIRKDIKDKGLDSLIAMENTMLCIQIPTWPKTKDGNMYDIVKDNGGWTLRSKNKITESGLVIYDTGFIIGANEDMGVSGTINYNKKMIDIFNTENFKDPNYIFLVVKSGIKEFNEESLVYLRPEIRFDLISGMVYRDTPLFLIKKEHIVSGEIFKTE